MPTYSILVTRTDTYTKVVEMEAESAEAARQKIQDTLDKEGWDAVCGDDEGDYEECSSEATLIEQ